MRQNTITPVAARSSLKASSARLIGSSLSQRLKTQVLSAMAAVAATALAGGASLKPF